MTGRYMAVTILTIQAGIIHQALKQPKANHAPANIFMTVPLASQGCLGAIHMHACNGKDALSAFGNPIKAGRQLRNRRTSSHAENPTSQY